MSQALARQGSHEKSAFQGAQGDTVLCNTPALIRPDLQNSREALPTRRELVPPSVHLPIPMTDSTLGLRLRKTLLRQSREHGSLDRRSVQGLVGEVCGSDQQDLLPALRYVVLCEPFLEALRATPPLGDPRLGLRLREELAQMFAPALCARMEPVLQGLLGLPQSLAAEERTPMVAPPPHPPPVAASQEPPRPPAGSAAGNGPGVSTIGLVTFLSFLCGGLAMALAVVLTWVEVHRRELTSPAPSPPARPVDVAPTPPVAPIPATPGRLTLPEPSPGSAAPYPAAGTSPEETAVARAVTGVQALYVALNSGDQESALQRMEGSALRELDPATFRQFSAVGVGELRPISILGSTVTLEGVVTFVNPDFSQRKEKRSFTVDISRDPPRITATAVGKALSLSR